MTLYELKLELEKLELLNSSKEVVFEVYDIGWAKIDNVVIEEVKGKMVIVLNGSESF